jgi:hypothetical protein
MKDMDCELFQDQLDSLQSGTLQEEGLRQLRLHAASCPDCAMALKVAEHLVSPSLEELEARVPDDLLASVWAGVSAETSGSGATRPPWRRRRARSQTWLVPALAAASVALLLSTGFLFLRLRSAESTGARLASEVADLQRDMAGFGARTEWVQRTAQLAGSRRTQARALDFALLGQDTVTVQALLDLLEQLPPDLVLFDTSRVEGLLGAPVRPSPELREILMGMAGALPSPGHDGGVRAGELERWLAASGLPRDLSVPKAALLDLLS